MMRSWWRDSPLDDEELKRVADVRRDVWRGAFRGMLSGACAGFAGCVIARNTQRFAYARHSKYMVAAVLVGSSFGAYLGAVTAGRNSIQHIGDVFQKNAKPASRYQQLQQEAARQQREEMHDAFLRRMQAIEAAKQRKQSQFVEPSIPSPRQENQ
jgi:hypothetical protein